MSKNSEKTGQIIPVNLTKQIKQDYLDYSMAVLLGRAIPDIYDGMKPVQRRVLQVMWEEGLLPDRKFVKSARVTGLTMAFYHPHGDCYGTLVNMATPWNNNVPWVDGHGNFGSTVDGPASSRYTECKLRESAVDILLQDKSTWELKDSYDGSRREAVRLNSCLPAVLLNGDSGIAVGFATKLAPHGLKSIAEAVKLVCKDTVSQKTYEENLRKARELLVPDFPTGTQIVKDDQLDSYTKTGGGNIRCMSRVEHGVQKRDGRAKDRPTLTFTCLPPGVNPEKIGEQIHNELEKGRIVNVAEVNDLSDIHGDCIEVVAKPGSDIATLKQQLYAFTDLDTKYSAKTLVIDGVRPVELSPLEIVQRWVSWRLDRLQVKFKHDLDLKRDRLDIVEGLIKAIDKMDLIIKKIRASKDKSEAKLALMASPFKFSDRQADAILEMKLRQLTNLDKNNLIVEQNYLIGSIEELEELSSDEMSGVTARKSYVVGTMTSLVKKYGVDRKSPLIEAPVATVSKVSSGTASKTPTLSKPRFMKVDQKKGTVEQTKGPRGSIVLDSKDKVILMTTDGFLRKVPATFKGAISSGYCSVSLAKRELEVAQRKYLAVFALDGQLKAMVLDGEDLCKCTSSGKRWLPDGASLVHFGENNFTVNWSSKRKKPTVIDMNTKVGKPGGKGIKVANLEDVVCVY